MSFSGWILLASSNGLSVPFFEQPATPFETVSQFFVLMVGLLVFLTPINWFIGRRQWREGNGVHLLLFRVSLLLGVIQTLPALAAWIVSIAYDVHVELKLLMAVETMVIFGTSLYLIPPIRLTGSNDALKRVEDSFFLKRLERMCTQLRIEVPVVRLLNSTGGGMGIQAFAGGLPAPSLVVSDGVLHRLSEDEVDAIIGHELGHIANRSLWWFPASISIAWTIAIVSTAWSGVWLSLLFGFAVQVGLRRIVSRYFEFDSDRKAAKVAGFRSTTSALNKIHISSPVSNKGWVSYFAYSVATHPSLEERLQALFEKSPADDRPVIGWSSTIAKRRKLGARIAFMCWVGLLVCSFSIPRNELGIFLRSLLYLVISLVPSLLINNAIRQDVKSELKRRQFHPKSKLNIALIFVLVILMFLVFYAVDKVDPGVAKDSFGEMIWIIFGLPFVLGAILVLCGIWRGSKSPHARIRLAIHQRRWQDAVALGKEFAQKIQNDAPLRNDLNLALWITGDSEGAISAMQTLRGEYPAFKHPWLIESLMHLESGETSRALELIDEVREDLAGDVSVHGVAARCYRQLGELESMEHEAAMIEEIIPDSAAVQAFRCAIAIDKRDLAMARELWEKADSLAPGDAYITLLKAELDHLEGNRLASLQSLEQAQRLIDATPFSFLGAELRDVAQLHNVDAEQVAEPDSSDVTIE